MSPKRIMPKSGDGYGAPDLGVSTQGENLGIRKKI